MSICLEYILSFRSRLLEVYHHKKESGLDPGFLALSLSLGDILISFLVRLRLREEVDVLKHLSQVARLSLRADGRHPNVLAYVDSWEEDEALYIRTELCELGNLARFLWEYGRAFPRLDEAKVWKVIVDLSSVSIVNLNGSSIRADVVQTPTGPPIHS